ncbi:MAG: hypothetical protein BWY68_00474 [bacterium ADurb.Bin400]|nr:MAG: hypothetical protein BWY68_00474 [bacterium ADurb.Bin400]
MVLIYVDDRPVFAAVGAAAVVKISNLSSLVSDRYTSKAVFIWRKSLFRCASRALALAPPRATNTIDAKIPITAITTSSSIKVKPLLLTSPS